MSLPQKYLNAFPKVHRHPGTQLFFDQYWNLDCTVSPCVARKEPYILGYLDPKHSSSR